MIFSMPRYWSSARLLSERKGLETARVSSNGILFSRSTAFTKRLIAVEVFSPMRAVIVVRANQINSVALKSHFYYILYLYHYRIRIANRCVTNTKNFASNKSEDIKIFALIFYRVRLK